jgi:hypothetical protein
MEPVAVKPWIWGSLAAYFVVALAGPGGTARMVVTFASPLFFLGLSLLTLRFA